MGRQPDALLHVQRQHEPSVEVAGPIGARPIVLLHCAAANRQIWRPQLESLAEEFRVIALDLPGHGARAGMPFRLSRARHLIAEVISAEAREPVLLVGLSLGGYVAINFAYRFPEQVAGLGLSGATADCRGLLGQLARILGALLIFGTRAQPPRIVNLGLPRFRGQNSVRPPLLPGIPPHTLQESGSRASGDADAGYTTLLQASTFR